MSEKSLVHAPGPDYKIYSCCYSGLHLLVLDQMGPILDKFGLLDSSDFQYYRTNAKRCISWSYGDQIATSVHEQYNRFAKELRDSDEHYTDALKRLKKQYRI